MKFLLFSCCLLLACTAKGQHRIIFHSEEQGRVATGVPIRMGKLAADPIGEAGDYQLTLPIGSFQIRFRPYAIAQYQSEAPSPTRPTERVKAWIGDCPHNSSVQAFAVSIDGRLQHLVFQLADQLYRVDPIQGQLFTFSSISEESLASSGSCGMPAFSNPIRPGAARSKAGGSCRVVDLVLVTDMAYNQADVSVIEAQLIAWVIAAQAYFSVSFNMELNLQIRYMFIPTAENPFPGDLTVGFAMVNDSMKRWLVSRQFSISDVDVVVGITSRNYNTGNFIGYTFNDNRSLGTIVIEAQPTLTVALLTHELGHVFGAGHDAQDNAYIMSPTINANGRWSESSKTAINAFLARDYVDNQLKECPLLMFEGIQKGKNIELVWEASYEQNVKNYKLEHATDTQTQVLGWVAAVGNTTTPVTYTFVHSSSTNERHVYRLSQYSVVGVQTNYRNIIIEPEPGQNEAKVWPNPFSDILQVDGQQPGDEVLIYDGAGRLFLRHLVTQPTVRLVTADWPPGIYLLHTNNRVWKLIKQ